MLIDAFHFKSTQTITSFLIFSEIEICVVNFCHVKWKALNIKPTVRIYHHEFQIHTMIDTNIRDPNFSTLFLCCFPIIVQPSHWCPIAFFKDIWALKKI